MVIALSILLILTIGIGGFYVHALRSANASLRLALKEEKEAHEKYWNRLRGIPLAGTRFRLEGVGDIIVIGHNFEEGYIEFCLSEDYDTRDPEKDFADVTVMSNNIDNFVARAEHALALM